MIDTSCLVAAFCSWHEHHEATRMAIEQMLQDRGIVLLAGPTLIETFSVLTRLPAPHRLSGENAYRLLEANWKAVAVVTLTASEYWRVLKESRDHLLTGGQVYDAVIAACARKGHANRLLTWDYNHFASLQEGDFKVIVPGSP